MGSDRSGTGAAARRTAEPEDAHRGHIAPTPADVDEARADREMAEAERAAAQGNASPEQAALLDRLAGARSHEERRRIWRED